MTDPLRGASPWLVLPFLVSTAGVAAAQPSTQDVALAEKLFQDAKVLLDAGDARAACPKFAESQRIDPRLGTLLNLATCHEQEGRTASAWAEFKDAAAKAARAGQQDRADYAEKQAKSLQSRLAKLTITAPSPAPGTELTLDDRPLGSAVLGTAIPVDPGEHEVAATAPGRKRWAARVQVARGPSSEALVVPPLEQEQAPAPVAPTGATSHRAAPDNVAAPSSTLRTTAWIAGGVGVVGLAVGGVFGLRASSIESDADKECPGAACPTKEGLELHDDAHSAATVSTVAFGVGLVGVAAGVVLLIASSGGDRPASAARIGFAPRATARGPGLGLVAAW